MAARAATPRRALALPPHPRGPAPANAPLQLRASRASPAKTSWLYARARRGGRELVHRLARRADELLAGPAGKRTPSPAARRRPRVEVSKILPFVSEVPPNPPSVGLGILAPVMRATYAA